MTLPQTLVDAMRVIAAQVVQQHAAPRHELDALRAIVYARLCALTADDRTVLEVLLPALAVLRPGTWCSAVEILALAAVDRSPAGVALGAALQGHQGRAKALGRLLTRCAGVPVNGMYLMRLDAPRRAESALYQVAGFPAQ